MSQRSDLSSLTLDLRSIKFSFQSGFQITRGGPVSVRRSADLDRRFRVHVNVYEIFPDPRVYLGQILTVGLPNTDPQAIGLRLLFKIFIL